MEKYINIIEENNQLRFDGEYEPIVCGNSIYSLRFNFSDVWNECQHKTAIFVVDGNFVMVEFVGNEVEIPVLPNASCLSVSLVSGSGEHSLATTALKLNLKTTPSACEIVNSEMFNGYLQQIHALINKIESGEIEVNKSKTARNVINNNLLINGDFRVNQRGKDVYERISGRVYTVDRWGIWSNRGTFNVQTKTLTNLSTSGNFILSQYLEDSEVLLGKTMTFSVGINGNVYHTTGTAETSYSGVTADALIAINNIDNLFYIRILWDFARQAFRVDIGCTPSMGSLVLNYAKLEIGSSATEFVPRSYVEELSMCQRYYQKVKIQGSAIQGNGNVTMYPAINLATTMRKFHSIENIVLPSIRGQGKSETASSIAYTEINDNRIMLSLVAPTAKDQYQVYVLVNGSFDVDCEIY